ncbi:MAG: multicopper oxidase family protein, partial [Pseudonocardiaceae bacterium]
MYANFNDFSYLVPGPLTVFCAIVGYRLGQAVYRPTIGSLRRSVRRSRLLWWVVVALALADVALVAGMWSYGWVFAANRVLVALPLILVPLVVALILALPRMRRLARGDDDPAAAPAALRVEAADPKLVVPVQATAVGGVLSFFVVFVARPVPPYATIATVLDGLLVLVAAVLWVRQQRTQRRVGGQSAPQGPGLGVRLLRTAGALVVIGGLVTGGLAYAQSSSALPGRYSMGSSANMDFGGGLSGGMPGMATGGGPGTAVSVPQLTGDDTSGTPDERFSLTAEQSEIRLSSGKVVDAWTYNGQVPGPELRVHQGDLVQVTLINNIPGIGVTLHWHGVNVPNAEDGVPGVTQNAVPTGQRFTYTFRVNQAGTFWYHSHQNANIQLDKGLFGALIILPKQPQPPVKDITVFAHQWSALGGLATLNDADDLRHTAVPVGTKVRLRLINTSSKRTETRPTELAVTGTSFAVTAIDGTDLHQPGALAPGTLLPLGAGGRYDVSFTMPDHPVRLTDLDNPSAGMVLI